jgi:hypothetical protein
VSAEAVELPHALRRAALPGLLGGCPTQDELDKAFQAWEEALDELRRHYDLMPEADKAGAVKPDDRTA